MPQFVQLHNHSEYSLLRASSTIKGLVEAAQAMNMPAIALTDDGNMFGALRFYKACKASYKSDKGEPKPVKPIVGCDFYLSLGARTERGNNENANRTHRIVLLAKNDAGYRNLAKMSSSGYVDGFYYRPRIDKEILSLYGKDLVALSGGIGGEIPQLLSRNRAADARQAAIWYRELFGAENFFLELTDQGIPEQKAINEGLIGLSKELGIPLVACNDTYYIKKSDAHAHDVLLCIGNKRKVSEPNRFRFSTEEFYIKSPEEMAALFGHIDGALENTLRIAEMCNLEMNLPGPLLPDYEVPAEFTTSADQRVGADIARLRPRFASEEAEVQNRLDLAETRYFVWLSVQGLRKRYGENPEPSLVDRMDFEIWVIVKMGFVGYFLIVWDFIKYAKDLGIPVGPGRGSGAGSIVAYSMEITDIDPIRYNLLFERFLNPERLSMPDFDIDFCFERRHEVIDYVTRKYGSDRTGQIITFGTLKPKAVIKDVARALDIPFEEANRIVKFIPDAPKIHVKDLLAETLADEWKKAGFQEHADGVKELYARGEVYKELFDVSIKLEGLSRHASTHAAGIVIGKAALTEYVPLFKDPKTGAVSTQYTMDLLEECGLVKMDFLGLKTLTLIKNTEDLVRKTARPDFSIEAVADGDRTTYKLLGEGKSSAVFQFDGEGMQKTLKLSKPTSIEDLTALNALYRPGPIEFIPQFAESKAGRQPISYPHPSLEPILKETYGIMIYQEQVMQAAQVVAGYTLGGADMLRRAMGKKKKEEMDKQRAVFVSGAAKKHGIAPERASEIFNILDKFAGYGFNKSHAAAYSLVSYRTAYLKANFPAQFMAANLTNEINSPDKFRVYLDETRGMGIEVRPPDVNSSDKHFTVEDGHIVFGIVGIKGVGDAVVDEIIRERSTGGKFTSVQNFLERVDLRVINRKSVEVLALAGCFDRISTCRKGIVERLDQLMSVAVAKKDSTSFGQTGLFDGAEEFPEIEIGGEEYDFLEKLRFEKELLGYYFSGHPLDRFRSEWERATTLDLGRLEAADPDRKYNLVAMLSTYRVQITKRGNKMGIATFEDYNGSGESVFFSDKLERFGDSLQPEKILGLICKVDFRRGAPQILIEDIVEPDKLDEREAQEVHVRLESGIASESENGSEMLRDLASTMFAESGRCPVFLHVPLETSIAGPLNGTQNGDSGKNGVHNGKQSEAIIKAGFTMSSREASIALIRTMKGIREAWKIYPAMLSQARAGKSALPRVDEIESSVPLVSEAFDSSDFEANGFDAESDSEDYALAGESEDS